MQQTKREILDQVLAFVGEPDDPVARSIAEAALNRAVEKIYMRQTWAQFVSTRPYTLTTVANQGSYALPSYFGRVSGKDGTIRNLTTGGLVHPIDLEQLQESSPEQGTSLELAGTPQYYAIGGSVGVALQPTSFGPDYSVNYNQLEVKSTSAADVAVMVEISGFDATGQPQTTQVMLNGLSRVDAGWWSFVETFSKAYRSGVVPTTPLWTSEGTVTLGLYLLAYPPYSTLLQKLLPDESARDLTVLTLYPKPATVSTISVPMYRQPSKLTRDADPLPDHWSNAIFEEMVIQWRCNTGELTLDTANATARPALEDLVVWDNLARVRPSTRPFSL